MKTLDILPTLEFLTAACQHYEFSAPTVERWADGLYIRINEKPETVTLAELLAVGSLRDSVADGHRWLPPNAAANHVYHLMHRLGQDVAGHAGF